MNDEQGADYWLDQPGAPKEKILNEKQFPITIGYDELIKSWQ